jgi:hypothetical protein
MLYVLISPSGAVINRRRQVCEVGSGFHGPRNFAILISKKEKDSRKAKRVLGSIRAEAITLLIILKPN